MQQLKRLADPDNLLNPGVIINSDPKAHLADLKRIPSVEAEIDKCIECGYCEPKCPSRELTLTPRQRIVVRREMARQQSRRQWLGTVGRHWIASSPIWRSIPVRQTGFALRRARSTSILGNW